MEYVYPAVFHSNEDGSYTITYPDLPGCISEGKSLADAVHMSQSALVQWITYLTDKNLDIPDASPLDSIKPGNGEFVNPVFAGIKDSRAVRRAVSIPKWMDEKASASGISLSRVLQDALSARFTEL